METATGGAKEAAILISGGIGWQYAQLCGSRYLGNEYCAIIYKGILKYFDIIKKF